MELNALTRIKVELKDAKLINRAELKTHGVVEVIDLGNNKLQLYIGDNAQGLAVALLQLINE